MSVERTSFSRAEWRLTCDEPGCGAEFPDRLGSPVEVRGHAAACGWTSRPWGGRGELVEDRCPMHASGAAPTSLPAFAALVPEVARALDGLPLRRAGEDERRHWPLMLVQVEALGAHARGVALGAALLAVRIVVERGGVFGGAAVFFLARVAALLGVHGEPEASRRVWSAIPEPERVREVAHRLARFDLPGDVVGDADVIAEAAAYLIAGERAGLLPPSRSPGGPGQGRAEP